MKKSELKALIQECLVEEAVANEPSSYYVLKLFSTGNAYGNIGKTVNNIRDLKGQENKYDANDTLTIETLAEAKNQIDTRNKAARERRKEDAKGMSTKAIKVDARKLPLYLWNICHVVDGKFTGVKAK